MADLNEQSRELAEVLERVNDEMRRFGKITEETAAALSAGSFRRARELEQAGAKTGDALNSLAKAGMDAGRAMLEGKKGSAAFNQSLDGLAQAATAAGVALTFLIPGGQLIKGVIAGITAVTTATLKYAQAANEMADKLYKGYSDLAKSGAAASDGMTGVFEDAKKLGLSMNELGDFVNIVGANSKDMALFAGSVFEGRKRLAEMGKSLEGNREEFLRLGLSMTEVADGMASYLRLQTRIGQSQNKTTAELAEGARKYLFEQDLLTKLTGMTRQEQEAAREAALSEQRFAAKLEELRQQGRDDEAEELMKTNLMLMSRSKELAQGFRDASTGMLQTDAAVKANFSTQGEILRQAQQVSAGQKTAAQATGTIVKTTGETAKRLGVTMGQIGTFDETGINLGDSLKMAGEAGKDFEEESRKAAEQLKRQREGGDPLVDQQAKLRNEQIKANEATERFIFAGIRPATDAMITLAKATTAGTESLNKLFGIDPESKAKEAETQAKIAENNKELAKLAPELKATREAYDKAMEGASLGQKMGIGRTEEQKRAAEAMRAAEAKEFALKRSSASASTAGAATMGGEMGAPEASVGVPSAPSELEVNATGPGQQPTVQDYIKFTSGTGSLEHFTKLHPNVAKAFLRMARDYNQVTGGDKLQVNSAYRSPEEQANINPGTNPKAAPGMSLHQHGRAVDIQSAQVDFLKSKGLLDFYGFKTLSGDPPHIYMRDGGVIPATPGGVTVTAAEAGMNEAFVPLPDGKTIPVEIKNQDPFSNMGIGANPDWAKMLAANQTTRQLIQQELMQVFPKDIKDNIAAHAAMTRKAFQTNEQIMQYVVDRGSEYTPPAFSGFNPYTGYHVGPLKVGDQRLAENAGLIDPATGLMPDTSEQTALQYIEKMMGYVGYNMGLAKVEMQKVDQDLTKMLAKITIPMGGGQEIQQSQLISVNDFGKLMDELPRVLFDLENMPKMAEGGVTNGPSIVGEAGPEAVIPLNGKTVPVEIQNLAEMTQQLGELITLQRDNNRLAEKILQVGIN